MTDCPYLEAKGWHMFVGYKRPDGSAGYACHGCGEYDTTPRFATGETFPPTRVQTLDELVACSPGVWGGEIPKIERRERR